MRKIFLFGFAALVLNGCATLLVPELTEKIEELDFETEDERSQSRADELEPEEWDGLEQELDSEFLGKEDLEGVERVSKWKLRETLGDLYYTKKMRELLKRKKNNSSE